MSLTLLDLRGLSADELTAEIARPVSEDEVPTESVREVLAEVRARGDEALRELTGKFDGVHVDELRVPKGEIEKALGRADPALVEALEHAYERILRYHRHLVHESDDFESGGVTVKELVRPVARAGIYAPGGLARYPSTVLMCAAPAQVAGVAELALCVPPTAEGSAPLETLAAAAVAGIGEVYRVGGAQAIAAMAFGTDSIRPVDLVVGPGNRYVAEAKRQVAGMVGVPSAYAGPSEVVVVADESTPPEWVAVDVLVQAEHGPDGLAWLVTWSPEVADRVAARIAEMVRSSPRRKELEATLASGGSVVLVDGPSEAIEVANIVAPEHLELLVEDAESLLPLVRNAGAVFCGRFAPASIGDYVAGPNHVLPTARTARFSSALRVDDFQRRIHAVTVSEEALVALSPYVESIAEAEGLPAHALSVRLRRDDPSGTARSARTGGGR